MSLLSISSTVVKELHKWEHEWDTWIELKEQPIIPLTGTATILLQLMFLFV